MSRTRRKKRRPLPLKQVLFSALAVLAALFVLILLNEALGSGLPLPGTDDVMNGLGGLYEKAGLSPRRSRGRRGSSPSTMSTWGRPTASSSRRPNKMC